MTTSDHVAIVTHEHLPGASHILRDYLNKKGILELSFIAHPLLYRDRGSYRQLFVRGRLNSQTSLHRSWALPIVSYPIDIILTVLWLWRGTPKEWYIGVGPLNACAGLLLKAVGRVKNVVFYSIDFVPKRFQNRIVNALYHAMETYAVAHADMCWDVSPRIREGRMQFLRVREYRRRIVPIGIERKYIASARTRRRPYRLGFVGHLLEKQGVQLILEALPVISRKFPKTELLIIGGGEYKSVLECLALRLHIAKQVTFTDWVADQQKVARLLSTCVIGLAPYIPEGGTETNFTYWADPTKLKTYLAAGLPVILTDVPYNAKELEGKQCATIIPYTPEKLSKAVTQLFGDQHRLKTMSKHALAFAKTVTWDSIFHKATTL
ncbi:MAG TPA: glycosyltransferase [Patescibacteria group bacterium]|nr:glycosyltransferase [Patescibacteria group bacterium]